MQRVTMSASRMEFPAFSYVLTYLDLLILLRITNRPTRSTWFCFTVRLLGHPFSSTRAVESLVMFVVEGCSSSAKVRIVRYLSDLPEQPTLRHAGEAP